MGQLGISYTDWQWLARASGEGLSQGLNPGRRALQPLPQTEKTIQLKASRGPTCSSCGRRQLWRGYSRAVRSAKRSRAPPRPQSCSGCPPAPPPAATVQGRQTPSALAMSSTATHVLALRLPAGAKTDSEQVRVQQHLLQRPVLHPSTFTLRPPKLGQSSGGGWV